MPKCISKGVWIFIEENASAFDKNNICTEKMMLTIIWNPNSLEIIDFLPKDTKYNSVYFINSILKQILEKNLKHGLV